MGGSASANKSSPSTPAAVEKITTKNTAVTNPTAAIATATDTVATATATAAVDKEPIAVTVVPFQSNGPGPPEEPIVLGALNIYYGTATGTAMGFARTLANEGNQKGFKARAIDLEDLDPASLAINSSVAIFVMATAGEGEPTDNAANFSTWMSNTDQSVPKDYLTNLSFTVFGLGNKTYENYNKMGKRTNAALESFGAKRVYPYGEGDDSGTLDADFDKWKSKLWPALIKSRQ